MENNSSIYYLVWIAGAKNGVNIGNIRDIKMTDNDSNLGLSIHDIKLFEEPNGAIPDEQPVKSKRGRKKTDKYVSYDEARKFIQGELIQSRTKYFEWWERHKPKDIPRFPYRIYKDVWVGWNEFLGNENTFGIHNANKWRPYEEAMAYVHSLHIESYNKWLDFCREDENLPEDIPTRPDLVYPKWRTWNHWLGNKAVEAVEAKREIEGRTQVYYVIQEQGFPENVLTFGVEPNGVRGLKDRWDREQFTIVRAFWYNREEGEYIDLVIGRFSTPYLSGYSGGMLGENIGVNKQRIVPNYWEILYYLEQRLDKINLAAAYQTTAGMRRDNEIELL